MIKLVLSDLDGTLVPLGQGQASPRTIEAISTLRAAGVYFGLATGRDIFELARIFPGNPEAYGTGILSNGKKVMVDGELTSLTLVDNEGLQRMATLVEEYPDTFVTAYPLASDPSNPVYCIGASEDEIRPWSERYSFAGIPVAEVPSEKLIAATIACLHGKEMLDEIKARGAEICPDFDFLFPAPNWCDIVPKNMSKAAVLPLLTGALGVGMDEVMFFGDADNDLSLLQAVENSVAVANATASAKAAARWQVGDCRDEAVAEAMEEIARATLAGELPRFMRD
ncbi:MAG: HAD family hydrolase [Coriobacteriales bacterium]|nr:HAD family hydrolase [Coriobacteriales bacterium]